MRKERQAVVIAQKIRPDAEPEAEVTQVHPLEQPLLILGPLRRQMAVEEALRGVMKRQVVGRKSALNEGKQGPDGISPAPRWPCPIRTQLLKELRAPAFLNSPLALSLPCFFWLTSEVAHGLPADHGIAFHQPCDDLFRRVHHCFLFLLSHCGR